MLTRIPTGAYIPKPNYFPSIRNGYGVFGQKGLTIRNYKIEAMHQNAGGGTIFSITERAAITPGQAKNLFRIDMHPHFLKNGSRAPLPYLHYHYRWRLKDGTIKGSSKGKSFFPTKE